MSMTLAHDTGNEGEPKQEGAHSFNRFPPFPVDLDVLRQAQDELKSKIVKINEVADVILNDPATALELLSAANRKFHANERPAIWSVRTALFRLGSEQILLLLDELGNRQPVVSPEVAKEIERLRVRARQASRIARALALEVAPQLVEESQTAGLMTEVGYMFAVMRFKERYLKVLAATSGRGFAYRLEQELHFDVKKFRLDYLGEKWFPPSLLFVFDPETACKTESQANLRFIVEGATELLDAGEAKKLDKYAPENELPGKSALRYLEITPAGRERIFDSLLAIFDLVPKTPSESDRTSSRSKLVAIEPEVLPLPAAPVVTPAAPPPVPIFFVQTEVDYLDVTEVETERPLTHFSEQNQRVFQQLKNLADQVESTDLLIRGVLSILTENGPFARANLLVFDRQNGMAEVHLHTGGELSKTPPHLVEDPLSPLATANTQIRSFNAEDLRDALAPFGVAAYALSPVRVNHPKQVALYADCGDDGVVPFEARRVFRYAVGLLNRILLENPSDLPG